MFAEQIRNPGNSAGIAVHHRHRFRAEDIGIFGSRDSHALLNISVGFLERERARLGAQRDALPELAQLRLVQFLFEFGLPGENDLQQLFRGSLQVRQQSDFLEHLRRKILRLVDDQHGAFSGLVALQQPLIQLQQHLPFLLRFAGDAEVGHHEIEKLRDAQPGIEDETRWKRAPCAAIPAAC